MNYIELVTASIFYQCTMYCAIRLAHRGFTLGEVALTAFGATVLFFELVFLTTAKANTPFLHLAWTSL
jgi:dolichol kinase